jgi:hypothetical protein
MAIPEPAPGLSFPYTDSIGSPIFIFDGPGERPKGKKVDPSTIWWPEGVPKPWEKPKAGPEKPPTEK